MLRRSVIYVSFDLGFGNMLSDKYKMEYVTFWYLEIMSHIHL